jgi:hypothetical protein
VAWDWFNLLMIDTFKQHYTCTACVDKTRCEYWVEACTCYLEGNHDNDEIIFKFWEDCDESLCEYGLMRMNEWRRCTVFGHKHGQQVRQLRRG